MELNMMLENGKYSIRDEKGKISKVVRELELRILWICNLGMHYLRMHCSCMHFFLKEVILR